MTIKNETVTQTDHAVENINVPAKPSACRLLALLKFYPHSGIISEINPRAKEILDKQNAKPSKLQSFFQTDDEYLRFITTLLEHEVIEEFEVQLSLTNGTLRWFVISSQYHADTRSADVLFFDINGRKQHEFEVAQLKQDLDKFIYHVSHDLRAPLANILGLVSLVQDVKPVDPISQYVRMIGERASHLDHLLKDLSAITFNNNSDPYFERIFITEEIEEIYHEFETEYPTIDKQIFITSKLIFYSDIIRFRIIMRNLISNALKYHNPICKNPFIKVEVIDHETSVLLKIQDNGIGMDDIQLMKIENILSKGQSSFSETGLGLFIVKSMIDKLRGNIKVDSVIGRGTTFCVNLPNKIIA